MSGVFVGCDDFVGVGCLFVVMCSLGVGIFFLIFLCVFRFIV